MVRFLIIVLLLLTDKLQAQSDFDMTQRWFNESIYNPAATGNHFTTSIFLHSRAQWIGLEGAPTSQVISADTYAESIQSAFGLSITGDQIGFAKTFAARLAYAYYFSFNKRSVLALGLSASVINRHVDASGALVDDLSDPELYYANASEYSPDFDFGLEYKGTFKLGAAIRHFGGQSTSNHFPALSPNIWMYASTRFNMQAFSVEPTVSYMYRNKIGRIEAGALFYFLKTNSAFEHNDKFWIGTMARFNGQFAILLGATLTKRIRIGYSFDYGMGDLALISKFGTHEIFIAWQLDRIFYKDKLCPAYQNSRHGSRQKKKFMQRIRDNFSM